MRKYLKYILTIIFFVMVIVPNKVSAASSSTGYIITSYNIDMVVNEDNTFNIIETITAYFTTSKHGIYRKIPLKNNVTRTDGTTSNNRAKISNISVNENYTTSNERGYKVIKIGDLNKTITGSHTYTIKYTYNIGKDPLKDADELYFNLIGNEWDTSISNVTFTITMPKSFDKSLLGFSSGVTGSTNSSNISYTVNGNIITGSLKSTLSSGQALTVRLTLPEGYFVGASSNIDVYTVAVIIISLICVLIAYSLWAKYGKDDEVVETVEFYPPEGYNSAEVGFLYEGIADTKDIISLLIYLADKGYLKIEEISRNYKQNSIKLSSENKQIANLKIQELEEKIRLEKLKDVNSPKIRILENSLQIYKNIDKPVEYELSDKEQDLLTKELNKQKEKFRIIKLKNYDGNNEYERMFFEGLFTPNSNKNSVTITDLYNKFYITLNRIKAKINSKKNKNKIFESSASGKGKWLILMIIALFILITIKPIAEYSEGGIAMLPFALIFPGIGFTFLIGSLIGAIKMPKILELIWSGMFGGIPWAMIVLPALTQNTMYLITYIVGIICIAVIILFAKIMPKRTPYGNEILGKLRGFKRFLETAEKTQLESLVSQNPEYFYNILPYTYALGVSDVWINQFETIALQAPNWYDSSNDFDMHTFGSFMTSTMASATTAMSSSPSSNSGGSSGGSSSGGGSSGGGSGGGGGGSW